MGGSDGRPPGRVVIMRFMLWLLAVMTVHAESGRDAWLRYAPSEPRLSSSGPPPAILVIGTASPVIVSARDELLRGVHGMLGRMLRIDSQPGAEGAIVLGTVDSLRAKYPQIGAPLKAEGFRIQTIGKDLVIAGADSNGVLYGAFTLLRKIAAGESFSTAIEQDRKSVV